jgi:hypothetical protein
MLKCYTVISCKKPVVYRETGKTSTEKSSAKSFIRNILPITPVFPIFSGHEIISPQPNSFKPNILARSHKKNCNIDMHPAAALTHSLEKNSTAAPNSELVRPRTRELDSARL